MCRGKVMGLVGSLFVDFDERKILNLKNTVVIALCTLENVGVKAIVVY